MSGVKPASRSFKRKKDKDMTVGIKTILLKSRAATIGCLLTVITIASCATDSAEYAAQETAAGGCTASRQWISNPSMPKDVAAAQSNCDFHRFMWQSFLFLAQPVKTGSGVREFETYMPSYGLFVGAGEKPAAWGSVPKPGYCEGVDPPDAGYVFSDLTLQAGVDQPLIDRAGDDVFYNVSVNREDYQFITGCDL
jgi:hypothetical protein